jgi:glycosyltransferase involved in cell wall biosynthesis
MISVIVPTRNSARTLDACLTSIRAQQDVQVELIVVDNKSSDRTCEIAKQYADIVAVHGPERSCQRNFGGSLAKGDYLFFVDSDMVLSPGVAFDCLSTILDTKANGIIVPEQSVGKGFWAACRALERSCYQGDDLVEAARFFPRRIFEEAGGFDERLTGPEDWDLTLRISAGQRLPRTTATITHDEGQIRLRSWLRKKWYYGASMGRYFRKHGPRSLIQGNILARPAFLKNWRRLIRKPLITSGLLVLKALESVAGLLGMLVFAATGLQEQRG